MKIWVGLLVAALTVGLAPAPATAAPPLEVYGRLPAMEMVEISPDGTRLAFTGLWQGRRAVTVREIDGPVLASTPVNDVKIRGLQWVGNDIVLVTSSATQKWQVLAKVKAEITELVAIDLKAKTSFPVIQGPVLPALVGWHGVRRIDDRWYAFLDAYQLYNDPPYPPLDGYPDLIKVDLQTAEPDLVAQGKPYGDDWEIGSDGKLVARSEFKPGAGTWSVFVGDRMAPLLTRKDTFGNSSFRGLGRYPGSILAGPPEYEDGDYYEIRYGGVGAADKLELPPHVRSLLFDSETQLLIGVTAGIDDIEVKLFDPKAQARVRGALRAFPDQKATLVSWSRDFGRLVVSTDGAGDAGTYWLVDIASGKAKSLGVSYAIASADVGPVSTLHYTAADGMALEGVLTLPPGGTKKNLPLVVLPHGGPNSRDHQQFDWWAQAFASRGYAVFQPNFRGSSDLGLDYRLAGEGQWGRKMQTDISDGVAALAAQGVIDPKRACIVGGSYGGYAALAGVTVQQGQYRCAVSYAGITDLSLFLKDEGNAYDTSTRYWKKYMGLKGRGDPVLKQISPAALIDKIGVPVLLIHGADDTVVPIKQSEVFRDAAAKAGKPVEMVTLSGEDHWLSREETRTAMLKASVAFVEKNNPAN